MRNSPDTTAVDFWFDPACPVLVDGITLASRDPAAQAAACASPRDEPVHAQGAGHRARPGVPPQPRGLARTARVATAAATRFGEDVLEGFYAAYGELFLDRWRRPSEEYHEAIRAALPLAGPPGDLEDAMDCDAHDRAMRRSHDPSLALVGGVTGIPITSVGGAGFHGPVLNAIPRGEDAVRVFDRVRLLAGCLKLFVLKRTRVSLPVLT